MIDFAIQYWNMCGWFIPLFIGLFVGYVTEEYVTNKTVLIAVLGGLISGLLFPFTITFIAYAAIKEIRGKKK
jgi:Na+-translocating ferredoxin:NAD+ oxidoreductase RnfE subunit